MADHGNNPDTKSLLTPRRGLIHLGGALIACSLGILGGCDKYDSDDAQPIQPPSNPLRNPYFGDLHVHTARSLDAGLQGVLTSPDQAYTYAKGEALKIQGGTLTVQLGRPLDFAAVTDHAEYFGNFALCEARTIDGLPNPIYNNSEDYTAVNCPNLRADPGTPENAIGFATTFALSWLPEILAKNAGYCFDPELQAILGLDSNEDACFYASTNFWKEAQGAANRANEPGFFTAFKAYEWTGGALSANLHRNIIFGTDKVVERPFSYFEAPRREAIWSALANENCGPDSDECKVLIIPHNSNLSQGRMFEPVMPSRIPLADPVPMDAAYASQLSEYERLVEIMQHKGQSECVTANGVLAGQLDPPELINRVSNDELCDFEIVSWATLAGAAFDGTQKPQDFVRDALKVGLTLIDTGGLNNPGPGLNPFKYGIIASTDTHQGAPGMVNEATHPGHGGGGALFEDDGSGNPDPEDPLPPGYDQPKGLTDTAEYGPGGLAVVWAEENTRESLFEAMRRKEVYGTSGTRPVVRFFGGFDLPADLCESADPIRTAYDTAVPMGGSIGPEGSGRKPRFYLSALMDQGDKNREGTRLQRIQIIKGWVDSEGNMREQILDVAGSADNGAGVDVQTCEPIASSNGATSLCAVWEDEDFDPEENAFYYGRVLENPVCRWHTYQCNAVGLTEAACNLVDAGDPNAPEVPEGFEKCCSYQYPPDNAFVGLENQRTVELPRSLQERAWTTPVWYEAQ